MASPKVRLLRYVVTVLLAVTISFLLPVDRVSAGSYAARTTLLKNREFAEALIEAIRTAKQSVHLSFFLFKATDSSRNIPRQIADELIRAQKRGLNVTVLLERPSRQRSPAGGDSLEADNRRTAAILSKGGVKVWFDSPSTTTHTKAAVIDGRLVFIGSHNLSQSALLHNNELSVMLESPELAAEVNAYLEQL